MTHIDFQVIERERPEDFSINMLNYCPLINDCKFVDKVLSKEFCNEGKYQKCSFYQIRLQNYQRTLRRKLERSVRR